MTEEKDRENPSLNHPGAKETQADSLQPGSVGDAGVQPPSAAATDTSSLRKVLVPTSSIRGSPLVMNVGKSGAAKQDRATPSHDDHPFILFANSFDTLSEADHYSFTVDHTPFSPSTRGGRAAYAAYGANGGIDIALPELKHAGDADFSLGDISPIKLVYNNDNGGIHVDGQSRLEESFMEVHGQDSARWKTHGGYVAAHGGPVSNPFFVMRSARKAFEGCKYLLPCLRADDLCPVNFSNSGHIHHYRGQEAGTQSVDVKIATRRVETAICAFGGTLYPMRKSEASSIFRLRGDEHQRQLYERSLPNRYYLSGSVISWEFEENPPVNPPVMESLTSNDRASSPGSSVHRRGGGVSGSGGGGMTTEATKMKYRCKLCGQLKQNHECPYRQSLHRSIGVMVYPAVNSFTAAEPGIIAPALTKMNNFVSYDSDHVKSEPTYSGDLSAAATKLPSRHDAAHPATVTPATLTTDNGGFYSSPQSSLSNHSDEGFRSPNAGVVGHHHHHHNHLEHGQSKRQKRLPSSHEAVDHHLNNIDTTPTSIHQRAVFVTSVTLRAEHYRAVTPAAAVAAAAADSSLTTSGAYDYPVIPLAFAERKRLSDTLFHLSKEIPSLTADCAFILREARKNNEWDLAVAELITQVVVGLYCGEGNTCLDGLQQYLLTLGISC